MKNKYVTFVQTALRNAFFVSAITLISVMSVNAQKSTDSTHRVASVSYLGTSNDQLSFALTYENESGEKYAVTILDTEGNVLFDGIYGDKKFNKTFKVPAEMGDLSFIISNARNRADKKFQVNTEYRVTEEVYVTKSK